MDGGVRTMWMQQALEEANKAFHKGEVPVGAVLVYQNQIISRAHNQVETLCDATAHAELLCLRQGAQQLGNWRLLDCTLYTTLQPCTMCSGAIILSRVGTLIWGAPDLRHGADPALFSSHPIHQVVVQGGLLQEECGQILKIFFRQRRAQPLNLI
jgi:tRNA(adenine34) deaminase